MNELDEIACRRIAECKQLYSGVVGKDIGIPATVDRLLANQDILVTDGTDTREEKIFKYFFVGPKIPDEHGRNQVDGELKRYVAYRKGTSPRNVNVGIGNILDYLNDNKLPFSGRVALSIADEFGFREEYSESAKGRLGS